MHGQNQKSHLKFSSAVNNFTSYCIMYCLLGSLLFNALINHTVIDKPQHYGDEVIKDREGLTEQRR